MVIFVQGFTQCILEMVNCYKIWEEWQYVFDFQQIARFLNTNPVLQGNNVSLGRKTHMLNSHRSNTKNLNLKFHNQNNLCRDHTIASPGSSQ